APPMISGFFGVGEAIACDPGSWTGATSFTFKMWKDVDRDGGRDVNEAPLIGAVDPSTGRYLAKLTSADMIPPGGAAVPWPPQIGCSVTAHGPGGYFARSAAPFVPSKPPVVAPPQVTEPPVGPPATTPVADTTRPTLMKGSTVCTKTACRVAIIAYDPDHGALGVKRLDMQLFITRTTRTRIRSGKSRGKIRTTTRTIKKTLRPVRSGDEWRVSIKGFRKGDRPKLKIRAYDAAGNLGTLTAHMKLRTK
ncbi:MAG: hypothetical protein JHD16_08160, partial [Solirubrobacteraceae bacterium]|nr:hypothetical protein [Solirubrobacteraceae bacterium]